MAPNKSSSRSQPRRNADENDNIDPMDSSDVIGSPTKLPSETEAHNDDLSSVDEDNEDDRSSVSGNDEDSLFLSETKDSWSFTNHLPTDEDDDEADNYANGSVEATDDDGKPAKKRKTSSKYNS
jgi:hypothetical protein